MLPLLLAALLQDEPEPPKPSADALPPVFLTLAATYFEIHQAGLDDAYGPTVVAQARVSGEAFLEFGGRWLFGGESGRDADLGVYTLGIALVGGPAHGGWQVCRLSVSAGAAVLASGDLDDDVDFGGYLSVRFDVAALVALHYDLIVPERDAGFGGREIELIQGFSLGLTVCF